MTGEDSHDCRPGVDWTRGATHFTPYSTWLFAWRDEKIREWWWRASRRNPSEWDPSECYLTRAPDNITQSGFLPVKPEESSSSDPDLPQGQDFDVILSDVEDSPPRQLVRSHARAPPPQARAHRGGKRPRADMFAWNDHHAVSVESDEEGDEVDLGAFFKRHRVAERRQVYPCLVCKGLYH